jgi:predicted nucleic acid-binding protein
VTGRFLLDSSFVVDLLNEIASDAAGPALRWLRANPRAKLWISPVTLAEVLEGADDVVTVKAYLSRYSWQGIHGSHAERVAVAQRRARSRMGENDAWQVAVAQSMRAAVLGHDRAFRRLGVDYHDYRA